MKSSCRCQGSRCVLGELFAGNKQRFSGFSQAQVRRSSVANLYQRRAARAPTTVRFPSAQGPSRIDARRGKILSARKFLAMVRARTSAACSAYYRIGGHIPRLVARGLPAMTAQSIYRPSSRALPPFRRAPHKLQPDMPRAHVTLQHQSNMFDGSCLHLEQWRNAAALPLAVVANQQGDPAGFVAIPSPMRFAVAASSWCIWACAAHPNQ